MMATGFSHMTVKDLIIPHPAFIDPDDTLEKAAGKMKGFNCGILPVGTADSLDGIITDRDIVIHALVNGKNHARDTVRNFMTPDVIYCHEDDRIEDAANLMQARKVNRLIVKDRKGRVAGILSFGDIMRYNAKGKEIAAIVRRAARRKVA